MKLNEVDTYLELGRQLQRAYGTHIDISLGFEVDYIPGFESDIQEFLDRYGPLTDDNILSVHFMEGVNNAFYRLDYSPEEFEKGSGRGLKNNMSYITNITPPCAKPCVLTSVNIHLNA